MKATASPITYYIYCLAFQIKEISLIPFQQFKKSVSNCYLFILYNSNRTTSATINHGTIKQFKNSSHHRVRWRTRWWNDWNIHSR